MTGLEPAEDGRMWWNDRYRGVLVQAGLTEFDAVMRSLAGECLRVLEDRENWHLKLNGTDGRPYGVYLKKHHVRTWESRIRAKLGRNVRETAGRIEAQNVESLTSKGIDVMNLVAYGEKLNPDGLVESFVLTEELDGYIELGHFLRQRFAAIEARASSRRDPQLDGLIRQLAGIAHRFHTAGYNHRDLYCCHFFVKEPIAGQFEIRLIDLQRVQYRRILRRRWLVKDLAQLSWSAPRDRITCTQKMAFFRHYLGVQKLRQTDKRLLRRVMAKQRAMERRLGTES